jgi:hypothetical protein
MMVSLFASGILDAARQLKVDTAARQNIPRVTPFQDQAI